MEDTGLAIALHLQESMFPGTGLSVTALGYACVASVPTGLTEPKPCIPVAVAMRPEHGQLR